MIVMPATHPVSASFSIAGYRDVDAASDAAAYYGYLDSVAHAFSQVISDGIDQLRLGKGNAVLDVGCGHGASAALLAKRVGSSGRVVGLDSSHTMIYEAWRRHACSGLPIDFQVGDAMVLPFEERSFDAARADRVFMFLDDPERALAELVRVTKPGGRIVLTEGDIGSHTVDALVAETTRCVLAALSDRSPNGCIGRRLRSNFVDAGFFDIDLQVIPILTTSFAEWNERLGVERFVANATDQGVVTRERMLAWVSELRARDAQDRFTGIALLYVIAGTRPAP